MKISHAQPTQTDRQTEQQHSLHSAPPPLQPVGEGGGRDHGDAPGCFIDTARATRSSSPCGRLSSCSYVIVLEFSMGNSLLTSSLCDHGACYILSRQRSLVWLVERRLATEVKADDRMIGDYPDVKDISAQVLSCSICSATLVLLGHCLSSLPYFRFFLTIK